MHEPKTGENKFRNRLLLADREIPSPLEGTRFSENGMSTAGPGRPLGEGTGEG